MRRSICAFVVHIYIFTPANNFLRWKYFGPTRFIHRWTTLVHATLRVSDVIDKCNSWLADVTFDKLPSSSDFRSQWPPESPLLQSSPECWKFQHCVKYGILQPNNTCMYRLIVTVATLWYFEDKFGEYSWQRTKILSNYFFAWHQ